MLFTLPPNTPKRISNTPDWCVIYVQNRSGVNVRYSKDENELTSDPDPAPGQVIPPGELAQGARIWWNGPFFIGCGSDGPAVIDVQILNTPGGPGL